MTDLSSRFSLQVPEEHREAGPDGGGPQLGDGHSDQRLGRHEGKLRGGRVQRRPARLGGPSAPDQVLDPNWEHLCNYTCIKSVGKTSNGSNL